MPIGRIVLEKEVTEAVDDTKQIFSITEQNMSESVRIICEIAVNIKNDFQICVDILLSSIQKYCPKLMDSDTVLQVLKIYKKYQSE